MIVRQSVYSPIIKLTKAMRKIETDRDVSLVEALPGEFSAVAENFNKMILKLEEKQKESLSAQHDA